VELRNAKICLTKSPSAVRKRGVCALPTYREPQRGVRRGKRVEEQATRGNTDKRKRAMNEENEEPEDEGGSVESAVLNIQWCVHVCACVCV